MPLCKTQVLLQSEHFCIARCLHCQRISLFYHNLLAGFSPTQFIRFSQNLLQTSFDDHSGRFPGGEPQIVLHTCHQDIQFTFNRQEYHQLRQGLAEVLLLLEAQQILDSNS